MTQLKIFGFVPNFTEPAQIAMRYREYATRCDITLVDDTGGKPIRVQKYCNNNPWFVFAQFVSLNSTMNAHLMPLANSIQPTILWKGRN